MLKCLKEFEVWFVVGSQRLYGKKTLEQVNVHSKEITDFFNEHRGVACKLVYIPVVTTSVEITKICAEANAAEKCVGLIFWMHTFSPAKMWIEGLQTLRLPFMHLHTQFNRDIPWQNIDMNFMNLNQSAHGGREFGFICSRLRKSRKVVVGHWQDKNVIRKIDTWMRAACAWKDWQGMKIARFGDNMREVAVTEGDKVEAQKKFGYSVNGYGLGELANSIRKVPESEVEQMVENYLSQYRNKLSEKQMLSVCEAAKIELGMKAFLDDSGFKAFTTTFEDLHGLEQLPGLPVQRLMLEGYGFGAEGDWKTAALVRAMKVMSTDLEGGTSFMEDYTYHLNPRDMMVLGAHMLEVCPSISKGRASLEVHPLSVGGKMDPARLVFNTATGKGVNASIMDMGNRFRMLVNPCEVVAPKNELPNLPVGRVLWKPYPDLKTAAEAWILAGGAHHTGFSMSLSKEHLEDFALMADIECLLIDEGTLLSDFKKEIQLNETYYMFSQSMFR